MAFLKMCCTHKEDFEHLFMSPKPSQKAGQADSPMAANASMKMWELGLLVKALLLKHTGLSTPVWGPVHMQVHLEYSYLLLHRKRQFLRWREIGDGGFLPVKTSICEYIRSPAPTST